jgi:hypothetical protein
VEAVSVSGLKPTLLLAIAVLACRDATSPLRPTDFVGTYALRTVNGRGVPQTVPALPDSCAWSFQYGSLVLADGAFSLYLYGAQGCPGEAAMAGVPGTIGGALSVRGTALLLRAVDPTSPSSVVMELEAVISGSNATLTFPAGAMGLASVTSLGFGPRQTAP